MNKCWIAATTLALATAGLVTGTTTAQAAPAASPPAPKALTPVSEAFPAGTQGVPSSGIRMHYNSWWVGSFRDYQYPANFGSDVFVAVGAGQGQPVKNNSASVCNFDGRNARIFVNSGNAGANDFVPAKTCMNLGYTYNNNASWTWA